MRDHPAALLKPAGATLRIPPERLYAAAGWLGEDKSERGETDVEIAVRTDPRLSPRQEEALLEVYRGFLRGGEE